ncbi:MAG: prephenate dehydrogenase/arogenate dehydrogenase family protein [Clostridia bacterium]|nr:prephenate dehydrogenase/arogenate dehydrogenase family protein [Clostridia bacterium]
MTVGIVGLGLIGGSLAKAFRKYTDHRVLGYDVNPTVTQYAQMTDCIDGVLDKTTIAECELVLLAVYPQATVDYLAEMADVIADGTVVIDCGGIKRSICDRCREIEKDHGWIFIGGHPMAGLHHSGLKYAKADLYVGASMILTPKNTDDIALLEKVTNWLRSIGFGSVTVTTPAQHDEIIAFTSQLAHVVSNAYVKSPRAKVHRGFSAGSYRDLTRVARLNEVMWTELFLENKDNLIQEIDHIIGSLQEYREALNDDDAVRLRALLKEGSDRKERIDSGDGEH